MAIREFTAKPACSKGDNGTVISWAGITAGDEGRPIEMIGHIDRSVQVVGTLPMAARVQIQGSNDGVNFQVLTDKHGNTLDFSAPGLSSIMESVAFLKPVATAGAPNVSVHLLAVRRSRA